MGNIITGLGATTFVIMFIALIIFWPFAIIWALNTLFAFAIEYTFWTWLAVLILTASFGKTSVTNK